MQKQNYNYAFLDPKGLYGPQSGQFVQPRLEVSTDKWGTTTTNAKWIDPMSGQIFRHGVISVKEKDGTVYDINNPTGKKQ